LLRRLPEPVRPAVSDAVQSATWLKVRRALSAIAACPPEQQGPEVAIQILASFNLEPVEPALQLGLRCIPCRPEVKLAPLDTIEQQILDPGSTVYQGHNLATVILWRAEELMADLFFPMSATGQEQRKDRGPEIIARIKNLARVYLENGAGPLFVATLPVPPSSGGKILDSQMGGGLAATIAEVNAAIHKIGVMESRLRVLDVHLWAAAEGAALHDLQMDFMARQPFTTKAAISFSFFLARNLRPLLAPRRKVLAVDLDNTLWGGILGEDGARELKLGRDFPGSVFLRMQKEILELKRQGVLLVLASKNEEADARQAMKELPDMALGWEDFVCHKVNFEAKYLNLREAARELGLGLDSFAFLDDSDYEREQMRQFNPEVTVLNEKGDALHMLESLLRSDAFDTHHISDEDRKRHQEYELRSARTAQPQGNIEDFLRSLELRAKVETAGRGNIERVVQMLGKTNQFNVTTRRHSLEEVTRMAATQGAVCLTLRLVDKFGDQGIVGVLLAVPTTEDATGTLLVDSFLVSCRALGRGVEEVLWSQLTTRAAAAGFKRINAEYIPTAKNGLVAQIFERLGLAVVEESGAGKKYRLEPVKPVESPSWIAVEKINA
jgi:FkbH-like protein